LFKVNDKVHLLGKGLATISDQVEKDFGDGAKDYFQLVQEIAGRTAPPAQHFIPVDRAEDMLRKKLTKKEAKEILEILQSEEDGGEPTQERLRSAVELGDRKELASLLRSTYATEEPIKKATATQILNLEDLLLDELSMVLGVKRENVTKDLREAFPAIQAYIDKNRSQ